MKYRHKMVVLFICVLLILLSSGVSAESTLPYDGYIYNAWDESVPAPNGYLPDASYTGEQLGVGGLKDPSDVFVDNKNSIYISDTGNNRIIQLDDSFRLVKIYDHVLKDDVKSPLESPSGIFVDGQQNIYFAEKDNGRVVKMDSNGRFVREFTSPKTNLLDDDFVFLPYKVLVNKMGVVFILTENFSYGAISFSESGEFLGFWGSNRVEITAEILVNQLWKKVLSQDQKSKLERYLPIQYTGFDIDEDNFIYTCTQNAEVTQEQIKKLNAMGINVFPQGDKLEFGDLEKGYYMATQIVSQFSDISVSSDGLVNALDFSSGRIFQYDGEGRLLTIFGGTGDQKGLFRLPSAVDNLGDSVIVLDQSKKSLTVFRPTEYMQVIHKAILLYNNGDYEDAKELFEDVLHHNHNFLFAYVGLGKASFEQGEYLEAMRYFKLGDEREGYSDAYREYRGALLKRASVALPFIAVLCIPAAILINKWKKKKAKRNSENSDLKSAKSIFRALLYPTAQFEDFKYYKCWNPTAFFLILVAWFVGTILQRQATGFIFNSNNPDDINIIVLFACTIVIFLLCVVVNWAVTSLLEGKGNIKEIGIASSYCMLPYVFSQYVVVMLSHVLTLEEEPFLNIITIVGILWSVFLLLAALKTVHEYSVGKTIACLLLTIIGVAFVIFLAALMYGLVQQFISFFNTIYHELAFRG